MVSLARSGERPKLATETLIPQEWLDLALAKPPRPLCRRSELVHDWKARLGCDAGIGCRRVRSDPSF